MVQSRRRTRFAAEAFERLRVVRHVIGQELQGNKAAEFGVFGLIDHTHAAPAEFLDDAVVRDGLADHAGSAAEDCQPGSSGLGARC